MEHHDVSVRSGYQNMGNPEEVMNLYIGMRRQGISSNENSMAIVISSCGFLKDENLGYELLGNVIKSGLETQLSVQNSLISMFGSFSNISEAKCVFDCMSERDTISWNSIIAANAYSFLFKDSMAYFHRMRQIHGDVNSTTISTLLSVCASVDYLKWGRGLHALVVKLGFDSVVCVSNSLLNMYSESGSPEDAEIVFEEMPEKDLISMNSLIACYAEAGGHSKDALAIFCSMMWKQEMNFVTFTSMLAACSNTSFLNEGKMIHTLVLVSGLSGDLIVGNSLVTFYAKTGMMGEAKRVLQSMPRWDEVAWNALIGGYGENEKPDEALNAFRLMRQKGIIPNYITVVNILGASLKPHDLRRLGMPLHAFIVSSGFESDERVQNSLITMYGKCGDLSSSRCMFDGVSKRNSVAWNAMIAANSHQGYGEEVVRLIANMRITGVELDQFSFSEGLAASAKLAMLEEGQQIHGLAVKLGFERDSFIINAAADMYSKCGEIEDVLKILPLPADRSLLTWNVLISAFARNGYIQRARETFHQMLKKGLKPSHVTFVSLLSACSHGGFVDEGLRYYDMMTMDIGIQPSIEHCVCMIDLLGRSGRLAEAEAFIAKMPVKPNDLVWRTLLAGCKMYGDLDRGRKAAENLVKLEPSDDSAYVLSSNMFANSGRWDAMEKVRKQMVSKNIRKKPACSWVKFKDGISSFGIGDKSHPRKLEIYAQLENLKTWIREAGYVPDTSFALQDTDEEQKEHNLWNHSERLALAYALIKTPKDSTVRVYKNLRVCGDCHSVYKFVSRVTRRKIVLRDPFRFHHFYRGECSCHDYW